MDELPPLDPSPDATFLAVGRALTVWESMELALARLYSVFLKRPYELAAYDEYGRAGRIFAERLRILEKQANAYFFPKPLQEHEMQAKALLLEASNLSIRRHQIAHGMVAGVPVADPDMADEDGWIDPRVMYGLMAPEYAAGRLRRPGDGYLFGSKQIDEYALEFAGLTTRINVFAQTLSPRA
jgi:hypothetical protein